MWSVFFFGDKLGWNFVWGVFFVSSDNNPPPLGVQKGQEESNLIFLFLLTSDAHCTAALSPLNHVEVAVTYDVIQDADVSFAVRRVWRG